ncbi:MAG: hypothetical protein KDA86_07790 [Planctomycetaceae bacterium]|nr:hypothetical protein [Planctomycetaceae bacterium]
MTPAWVARLPLAEAICAARLRIDPDIRAAEHDGHLWFSATGTGDAEDFRHRLPEASLFSVGDDGQLIPWGNRVPTDHLPELHWQPLSALLPVVTPVALHAGRPQNRTQLSLVPSSNVRTANVLETSLSSWADYAVTAPKVRLQRWLFAISAEGDAIIRGEPLPPLPGRLYVDHDGIACPAGWVWSPTIDAQVIREMLGVQPSDLAIMDHSSFTIINARDFMNATRSAIRSSQKGE